MKEGEQKYSLCTIDTKFHPCTWSGTADNKGRRTTEGHDRS